MTKEAKVLKYLRESRQLSMRQAGRILGSSDALVSHSEHGRIDLAGELILRFLKAYGYEYSFFQDLVTGKIQIIENTLEQCQVLLKRLHPDKLKTIHSFFKPFDTKSKVF